MSFYKLLLGFTLLASSVTALLVIELTPMEFDKQIDVQFPVNKNVNRLLLFAGYPNCTTICPSKLSELGVGYVQAFDGTQVTNLSVLFVDLADDNDPHVVEEFARAFHSTFLGWQPPKKQRDHLIRALGIFYAPSVPEIDRPIRHSSTLYYLQRYNGQWHLKYAFQKGIMDKNELINFIRQL